MDVEGTYESGPLSGGVRFEITVESHDAFDVYPIMQKWNSYRLMFQDHTADSRAF